MSNHVTTRTQEEIAALFTQDLASFWANTYAEVKKDLKGRYPKLFHKLDPWVESLNNKKIDR